METFTIPSPTMLGRPGSASETDAASRQDPEFPEDEVSEPGPIVHPSSKAIDHLARFPVVLPEPPPPGSGTRQAPEETRQPPLLRQTFHHDRSGSRSYPFPSI